MPALPLIDPKAPTTYNGLEVSFGVAPILNVLAVTSMKHTRSPWTLYLINLETLVRDRQNKTNVGKIGEIVRAVLTDIQVLSLYISTYNQIVRTKEITQREPTVVFYLNNYNRIPKPYIKDSLPKGTDERQAVCAQLCTEILNSPPPNMYEDTRVLYAFNHNESLLSKVSTIWKSEPWPHKTLVHDLSGSIPNLPHVTTMMVSHIPLDFHLFRYFSNLQLVESYTGNMKMYNQLGKKVFGTEDIPFNKYTHLLLGDKWYMQPIINAKQRNTLKEAAIREKWKLQPDKTILDRIFHLQLVQKNLLIQPDI